MSDFNPEIKATSDGSHTLIHPIFGVSYHSHHGAITESETVFINNGLKPLLTDYQNIKLFEFGFGTGLNVFLTALALERSASKILYYAIDLDYIKQNTALSLNYPKDTAQKSIFNKIHTCSIGIPSLITKNLTLLKIEEDWNSFRTNEKFNLVYFDAFAPECQPILWNYSSLLKVFEMMSTKSILVTYCAKGSFKRTLKSIGFEVETLPGPPGKREMTRAIKHS